MTDSADAEELSRPLFRNGRYDNPWDTWRKFTLSEAAEFQFLEPDHSDVPDEEVLDLTLPVETPELSQFADSPISGIRTMWIGHASVLLQFDGITILTDPIFSDRCSKIQFLGPKRYRKPPCDVDDLPKVDAVIISHNHYDHLDKPSVRNLQKRFGDGLTWYVPDGLQTWFRSRECKNVVEMEWWDEDVHRSGVKFVCTPCQHWSQRGPFDECKTLWCSWAVIGPKHRFFFGGDTGYCKTFKEIGQKYGPFTMAAIPIGAYEPRWFMRPQHVNPEEAVTIHQDIRSRKSLGIHWGTFKLTYEPYLEPPEKLAEELIKKELDHEAFITLNHGKVAVLGGDAEEGQEEPKEDEEKLNHGKAVKASL